MNEELKTIKKIYGEEMMHLCRDMFPSILEKKGLLLSILKSNLAPTHSFASDIKEHSLQDKFKNWVYSFIDVEKDNQIITDKTPFELMDEAGYTLYECKSEEDIQKFRKYYATGEKLCTFRGGRLDRCHVFFAVKKNVDEIKRENFTNPKREDEYGTSVISIQFSKGKTNDLSIKNRYNHTVNNPDATFSNNLENIIPGLSKSFEKHYGLNIHQNSNRKSDFLSSKLKYVQATDGKFYRYNIERDAIYYCDNNIIVKNGNVVTKYAENPEKFILIEQYLVDLKKKSIKSLQRNQSKDAFVKSIYDVGKIEKMVVTKNENNKIITFNYEECKEVKIEINKNNVIVGYENSYVQEIGYEFLLYNKQLSSISLPQVQTIGDDFLYYNQVLSSISLPQVQAIGRGFLYHNEKLSSISLPNVKTIGNRFLIHNEQLFSISLSQVQTIGDYFLHYNNSLSSISLTNVETIGDNFLCLNKKLSSISLPQVRKIGDNFLVWNELLSSISLPRARTIGDSFLSHNEQLSSISLPLVQTIGNGFLNYSEQLSGISLPNVQTIGDDFLCCNEQLSSISLPNVQTIGDWFLYYNEQLSSISLPNVRTIGRGLLSNNQIICKAEIIREIEKRNEEINNQRSK